ncbi:MAG TPA: alpha-ketoglutarate-dependent dioxygenase AlkB, partial [Propionibacteriaceae bacterium]|nr:alpha-ketoglutarate-dependent dioxygenase AlkB [Propionibacteriaceae bacterium]
MVTRQPLGRGAWVDLLPGWLSGASSLFEDLLEQVPWRAERRQMYERVVDVPRLLSFYG